MKALSINGLLQAVYAFQDIRVLPFLYMDGARQNLAKSFIFYVVTLLFLAVGAITTLGLPWYAQIAVPSGTPAAWLVAVIWGSIFFLAAFSVHRFWDAPRSRGFRLTLSMYAAVGALVLCWNYLFFGLHLLMPAFVVSVIVALMHLSLIGRLWGAARRAAYLLLPYFVWVAYAAWLCYQFAVINP